MTLRIDNDVLPPRKRKKKVVWKLPDDLTAIPKFGMEDKRRILDLFKQKKKELKRQRKSQPGGGSINSNNSGNSTSLTNNTHKIDDDGDDDDPTTKMLQSMSLSSPAAEGEGGGGKDDQRNNTKSNGTTSAPPGFSNLISSSPPLNVHNNETKTMDNSSPESPLPNGAVSSPAPPIPPPTPPTRVSSMPTTTNTTTTSSDSQPLPQISPTQPPPPMPMQAPPMRSASQPPPGMPALNSFVVPEHSTLAQVVMERYYVLLTNGRVQELSNYYSPSAQKSLTVGGAHAVSQTPQERILQLQSLSGMVMTIKGILQQPTIQGAILVLITGTCIQPHALPFCHSLLLVPTIATTMDGGFQIQNDALCFLTVEG
eukprot:scaffold25721_cov157-Cylindrotheca_fusiformis.AAC.1